MANRGFRIRGRGRGQLRGNDLTSFSFLAYSKKGHPGKLHFTLRKIITVILIEGGLLTQSQIDKSSLITCFRHYDILAKPVVE